MISNPREVLDHLSLRSGLIVCDLGAGSGFYTYAVAPLVAPGQVYAVEIQKELLTRLTNDAHAHKLSNIHPIWADIEKPKSTKLRDGLCDVVIISNVLFQVEHKDRVLAEAKRILKKGGQIIFIEHRGVHSISEHALAELCIAAGLTQVTQFAVGGDHYGMIYTT